MKAFSGFITKPMILREMSEHQKMDNFIRGQYWDKNESKGCFIGCAINSINTIKKENYNESTHSTFAKELDVPLWFARMCDKLFEGVSVERSKKLPIEILEAINVDADLSKILVPYLIFIVESARTHTKNEKVIEGIDGVLFELKKDVIDRPKLLEARLKVRNAAGAAAYYAAGAAGAAGTADAAAAAADAYYAAYAAADAYYAAADAYYAAADAGAAGAAAYYAAADAACTKQYEKFADKLIELIKECV